MASTPRIGSRSSWSAEEIAREQQAGEVRDAHDREKSPEQRLEETVRLSRFMSELSQGVRDDLRAG
ncbi:MAG TPA: hypothetical protein VMU32_04825 [Solirubrobacteraceae bacterium]|nr:hypothetical protein [Solirubrobacteraceae bacterium]